MELPKFVRLNNTELRLVGNTYYRDAGEWSVEYRVIDDVLISWFTAKPWLHRRPLIEITEDEWRQANGRYAPDNV